MIKDYLLISKEERAIRRWFNKIDDDTIELKEKNVILAIVKACFVVFLSIAIYFDFIKEEYRDSTIHELQFTFMPETRFQKSWKGSQDKNNPGFTRIGTSKKDFFEDMWNKHKHRVWDGYMLVALYLFFLTVLLWPNKRRFRFDRKRGIIYTYVKGRLYVTEINKLARPLNDYINIRFPFVVMIWVHPYITSKYFWNNSRIFYGDYSIWTWRFILRSNLSSSPIMQGLLIEFMNPNTPPQRIDEIMQAMTSRRSPLEWLSRLTIGVLDSGLYCKSLPKESVLEEKLAHYFKHTAPKITMHESWKRKSDSPFEKLEILVISAEENKKAGYDTVPCPNLFDPPEKADYYGKFKDF